MSKPVLGPSPRSRAQGDGDQSHTINRNSLQPCATCARQDQAHLVLDPKSSRTWSVFCEQHCPVCKRIRTGSCMTGGCTVDPPNRNI